MNEIPSQGHGRHVAEFGKYPEGIADRHVLSWLASDGSIKAKMDGVQYVNNEGRPAWFCQIDMLDAKKTVSGAVRSLSKAGEVVGIDIDTYMSKVDRDSDVQHKHFDSIYSIYRLDETSGEVYADRLYFTYTLYSYPDLNIYAKGRYQLWCVYGKDSDIEPEDDADYFLIESSKTEVSAETAGALLDIVSRSKSLIPVDAIE